MDHGLLNQLRSATEDDVDRALYGAYVSLPIQNRAEALEFFNRMLDELTGERAAAEEHDDIHVADAAERHRRREQG